MSDKPRLRDVEARAEAATEGPWETRTTGVRGGDHWYVMDAASSIASIHASDGEDEAQREPDATFIAASRTDVPALTAAIRAVLRRHRPVEIDVISDPECIAEACDHEDECPADGKTTICAACDDMCESAYAYYAEGNGLRITAYPCPTVRDLEAHIDLEES